MEVVLDLFFHFQVEVRKNMKDNLLNKTTNGKAKKYTPYDEESM